LLHATAPPKIGERRTLVLPAFDAPVELDQRDDGNVQVLGQRLQGPARFLSLRDLVPGIPAGRPDQAHVVHAYNAKTPSLPFEALGRVSGTRGDLRDRQAR